MEARINQDQYADWLLHYQYMYKTRRSPKQKARFLNGLRYDIESMQKKCTIQTYGSDAKHPHYNLVCGDLKKADRVLVTYYDTPYAHLGSYSYFDKEAQKKKTMRYLIGSSLVWLVISFGVFFLFLKTRQSFSPSFALTCLWILLFLALFAGARAIRNGGLDRTSKIRNTSSILAMLHAIAQNDDDRTCYVFVDEGCSSEQGLCQIVKQTKRNAKIILLDSVGSSAPLHCVKRDGMWTILSGEKEKNSGNYELSKNYLHEKEIDRNRLDETLQMIDQI